MSLFRISPWLKFERKKSGVDQLISYLMPARDAIGTIPFAIKSVLAVMTPHDQLVIVDDASTDGTSDIIQRFSQSSPNITVVRNEQQLGVANSLNVGLSRCSEAFVGRIDADDVCLPWRRNLDLNQIKNGFDFGFSAAILFGEGMRWPLPQYSPEIKAGDLLQRLASGNPFVHSTMIARRDALSSLNGYTSLPAEDYDLWIRAAEAGFRFSRTPIPKILYRVHPSQVTSGSDWIERSKALPSRDALIDRLGVQYEDKGEGFLSKIARISRR